MPDWLKNLLPIVLLLAAIAVVVSRLPKIDVGHSEAFKRRRFLNWFPLGLTYALLYFGRYNLSANASLMEKIGLLTKQEYGDIDGVGSILYGVAFLLNGPLTDRWGGRATILIAAGGSALMNALLGVITMRAQAGQMEHGSVVTAMTVLFAGNMYFQSFGAVSIVKVNAPWFHVRERGVLGGVFGILISLGLYFAYDWSRFIAKAMGMTAAFMIPAALLVGFLILDAFMIRDTPGQAGFADFDTADASSGDTGEQVGLAEVARKMFSQKVIWIIIAIEFCSGFLRNAVMKWYLVFADKTGLKDGFVSENWGVLLCVAGILGGIFAGLISDHVFDSRRGPVASVLYAGLLGGTAVAIFVLGSPITGWAVVFMSLCVIGVHGMLSGTASMDFGGKKNAGVATGIIDGFVYLGTGFQSLLYARILPSGDAAKDPANWKQWPLAMLPVAAVGLLLATRVWNAKPKAAAAPGAASKKSESKPETAVA
ncbi:MFS transporter [Polyangium mundeleinium]|uniref:MFS transporter n=1 Tax=Polyangium mundeleinium TaxID=2995306 RepID=A0ABT5EDG3_9BACT|nr:MFS transporter [Polyangium mundeleinium]MDC0739858.1 MFS transporter [Polyangium mundeleinium]